MIVNKIPRSLFLFLTVSLLWNCATRSFKRYEKMGKFGEKEDFLNTIATIQKNEKLYGTRNQLLFYSDLGVLFHYAKLYDSSNQYLEKAVHLYDELYTKSVTKEALSLLTNDNLRPYRSPDYEITFLHNILALNYLALGKTDGALVEARRTQLLFNEWEKKKKKNAFTSDGFFHYLAALSYGSNGERDNGNISLFKSVQAYREGPIGLPKPVAQYAFKEFEEGDRQQDIASLQLSDAGLQVPTRTESEIILIAYGGKAPVLKETMWWGTWIKDGLLVVHYQNPRGDTITTVLPAPGLPQKEYDKASKGRKTRSGTTFHIKFSFPEVSISPSRSQNFSAQIAGQTATFQATEMSNMDKYLVQYLEENKNAILLRTVIRVVLRTISAQKTKSELAGSNPLANLLMSIGTDVLADQLEKADTRSCFFIPKTVHMTRIPVKPGKHSLKVQVHDSGGRVFRSENLDDITVGENEKKYVFYSSLK